MVLKRHGLSIGIDRVGTNYFLTLKAIGRLTHEDYATITPFIDAALQKVEQKKVRALFDATELEGWELRAAWDDFRLGLKHGSQFERIAIYGNRDWQETIAKLGSWFISGEVRFFEDYDEAMHWLEQ